MIVSLDRFVEELRGYGLSDTVIESVVDALADLYISPKIPYLSEECHPSSGCSNRRLKYWQYDEKVRQVLEQYGFLVKGLTESTVYLRDGRKVRLIKISEIGVGMAQQAYLRRLEAVWRSVSEVVRRNPILLTILVQGAHICDRDPADQPKYCVHRSKMDPLTIDMTTGTFHLSMYLDCIKDFQSKSCKYLKSLFPDLLDLYGDPVKWFFRTCLASEFVFDELENFVLNPLVRHRLILKVPTVSTSSISSYEAYMMPKELLDRLTDLTEDLDQTKLSMIIEEFVAASIVLLRPKRGEAEELIGKIMERSSVELNYDNIVNTMRRFINYLNILSITSKFNRFAARDSPLFMVFNYEQFKNSVINWINQIIEKFINKF